MLSNVNKIRLRTHVFGLKSTSVNAILTAQTQHSTCAIFGCISCFEAGEFIKQRICPNY
jgi:hypothetical protein